MVWSYVLLMVESTNILPFCFMRLLRLFLKKHTHGWKWFYIANNIYFKLNTYSYVGTCIYSSGWVNADSIFPYRRWANNSLFLSSLFIVSRVDDAPNLSLQNCLDWDGVFWTCQPINRQPSTSPPSVNHIVSFSPRHSANKSITVNAMNYQFLTTWWSIANLVLNTKWDRSTNSAKYREKI